MNPVASRARRWLIAIGIPVLAFLVLAAWAFASPVGASPDDDFHLPSIWCGQGERDGLCEAVDDSPARLVPTAVLTAPCYAFHAETDASCWNPTQPGMAKAERANADGLYPRLFYATMSVFASQDVQLSVITIRLVNAAFAVALLTGVCFALPRTTRPALVISVVATSIPLGVFVLASTNPSSWAILSAATVWICLYGATQTSGRRRWLLAALALFGTVIGAGARADSAVFAVYGAALALLLGVRHVRSQIIPLATAGSIAVTAALFYLNARQGAAALGGLDPSQHPLTFAQHLSNVFEVPSLWTGALGQANLGWFDTYMPAAVWVPTTVVFAGALFVGIRHLTRRRAVAVTLALVAMWIVPFVMLAQSNAIVGATVQPRYLLPLLIIALGIASLRPDAEIVWNRLRYWLASFCLWVSLTIALHLNIQRYTVGTGNETLDPGEGAQWWWPGIASPLVVWLGGSFAFAGLMGLLWVVKVKSPRDAVLAAPPMTELSPTR